jgi:hypothetical protein
MHRFAFDYGGENLIATAPDPWQSDAGRAAV